MTRKEIFLSYFKVKKIIVLGLAVVAVLFFNSFLRESGDKTENSGFNLQPLGKGFSLNETANIFEDKLKNYPSPDRFKKTEFNHGAELVAGDCLDYYFTILIYPEGTDYRKSPAASVLNRAYPCLKDSKFSAEIKKEDLIANISSFYYIIVADQPKEGTWYNPR